MRVLIDAHQPPLPNARWLERTVHVATTLGQVSNYPARGVEEPGLTRTRVVVVGGSVVDVVVLVVVAMVVGIAVVLEVWVAVSAARSSLRRITMTAAAPATSTKTVRNTTTLRTVRRLLVIAPEPAGGQNKVQAMRYPRVRSESRTGAR
jgi:hypothetical protein